MSPERELWKKVYERLKGTSTLMAMVDGIFDKVPSKEWNSGSFQAIISRGPITSVDDSSDCIDGAEVTLQIDVWVRESARSVCSDILQEVRKALRAPLEFDYNALNSVSVDSWDVLDDPDPLTQHGILFLTAIVEEVD